MKYFGIWVTFYIINRIYNCIILFPTKYTHAMMTDILRQMFGGHEYEGAENLIRVAFLEGKLKDDDIKLINDQIDGIEISRTDLLIDYNHLKPTLPSKSNQKFKLIYFLVRKFIQKDGLNETKRHILKETFSVIHHERSRIDEIIDSVMSNITLGHSEGETFRRLGYLLKPRQVNFN